MDRQKLSVTVVEAKDIPAKERHGADPYVLIKEKKGMKLPDKGVKTEVQKKTLTPSWNQTFELEFSYKLASLTFKIYDWDRFSSDDLMGKVHVPTDKLFYGPIDTWFPVTHKGKPAGQLHLVLNARFEYPLAIPNTVIPIHAQQFSLGLGWDQSKKGTAIDLDASIAFLDFGRAMVGKVNFQQLTAFGGAVKHSGDDRTGDGDGDDETIRFQLPNLPPNIGFIVVMINSYSEQPLSQIKSAYFRLLNEQNQCVCWWRLSQMAQKIGLLMGFLYRAQTGGGWAFLNRSHGCGGRTVEESIPQVLDQLTF